VFTKFNKTSVLTLSILFTLCGYAAQALSLESDGSASIEIEADQVDLDQSKGIAKYKGNVSLVQGSININAHSIQIYAKNGQLDHANIQGSKDTLARFEQQTQAGHTMSGEAQSIALEQGSSEIIFKGTATVNDGLNKISGALIHYNTEQHKIIANNDGKESGRVKMIFLPNTDPTTNKTNQEQQP
jgi:lipopolysaccharide export system protein LptA